MRVERAQVAAERRLRALRSHVVPLCMSPAADSSSELPTPAPWERQAGDDDDGEHAMADSIAIVTGASQGVGKGIAIALCKAGATVYMTGRHEDSVAAAAQAVVEAAGGAGAAVGVQCVLIVTSAALIAFEAALRKDKFE